MGGSIKGTRRDQGDRRGDRAEVSAYPPADAVDVVELQLSQERESSLSTFR